MVYEPVVQLASPVAKTRPGFASPKLVQLQPSSRMGMAMARPQMAIDLKFDSSVQPSGYRSP